MTMPLARFRSHIELLYFYDNASGDKIKEKFSFDIGIIKWYLIISFITPAVRAKAVRLASEARGVRVSFVPPTGCSRTTGRRNETFLYNQGKIKGRRRTAFYF